MRLNEIKLPAGRSRRNVKRIGRGNSSGHGGTSGKGHKGQKARSGGMNKVGFEGGQMPLRRRLPKRGFTNIFRRPHAVVNIDQLGVFSEGTEVDIALLMEKGIVRKELAGLKILGRGEIRYPLTIKAAAVSKSARKKIEAAGGKIEVMGG